MVHVHVNECKFPIENYALVQCISMPIQKLGMSNFVYYSIEKKWASAIKKRTYGPVYIAKKRYRTIGSSIV